MEFFRATGISGFGVVGLTVLLLVVWLVVLVNKPSPKGLLLLAGVSMLPLLIGLAGALVGRAAARSGTDAAAILDPQEAASMLAAGYRQANAVAYLGLAATATLWLMCLGSLPIVRRRDSGT